MTSVPDPPDDLLAGRRALESLSRVELLHDWQWFASARHWGLLVRLSPDGLGSAVPLPASTNWWILVDPDYPWGVILVCPAKQGGIEQTFPHQNYNGPGQENQPWRAGNVCVSTPARVLGRSGHDVEPYDVHRRLAWNISRTMEWLRSASRGELVASGDPFELPRFPLTEDGRLIAFCEGPETLAAWQRIEEQVGLVDLTSVRSDPAILVATCFRTAAGTQLSLQHGEAW